VGGGHSEEDGRGTDSRRSDSVADRVAQMVVKQALEPDLEPIFLPDSYGYRPGKSALDAVAVTRERCWRYDWVLEFDIKGLFDNIDHTLLLRALEKHTACKWVRLYIGRWLTAPLQLSDGTLAERAKGTPQGGVVSPLLANLFLHYAFDAWMNRTFPGVPWCRYADDGLIHCETETQAQAILAALADRLAACGLAIHPDKTHIVYCKDGSRKEKRAFLHLSCSLTQSVSSSRTSFLCAPAAHSRFPSGRGCSVRVRPRNGRWM